MSGSPNPLPPAKRPRPEKSQHHVDQLQNVNNSTGSGDERQYQRQKPQRATLACERCRMKKLRCLGGHPCSSCTRAKVECDFGDRALASQPDTSLTSQRISDLENTVRDLVSGLSHLTRPQHPGGVQVPTPTAACMMMTPAGDGGHRNFDRHAVYGSSRLVPNDSSQSTAAPAHDPNSFARTPSTTARSEHAGTNPLSPNLSEDLDSRWRALQYTSAPFPPLMAHPAVWSGEPAKDSPANDPSKQPVPGMTSYNAKADLYSEPVSDHIIDEPLAREFFVLFFQKCHPLFPLLAPCSGSDGQFDEMRSLAPFLFTVILAIAGQYYNDYLKTEAVMSNSPPITTSAFEALTDLAYSHLGFVLFRKEHHISDIQATLLLSVWLLRPRGKSPDQWMITGLCSRLACRIGLPESLDRLDVESILSTTHFSDDDRDNINNSISGWHTWLMLNWYDTSLSLGLGRPHASLSTHATSQKYLSIVRKLGNSNHIAAATYVTSLVELSTIAIDLITRLLETRLLRTLPESITLNAETIWGKVFELLADLNPRLDEWQHQWIWTGSYHAIALGRYTNLVKIYGEHTRLCLNSLSLNLITATFDDGSQEYQAATSCLAKACEGAVAIVQYFSDLNGTDSIVRYSGHYLLLVLAQAAIFFVRVLVARLEQPLPIDQRVLAHYLTKAIEILEEDETSATSTGSWVAHIIQDLVRHSGLSLETGKPVIDSDANLPENGIGAADFEWDFDISTILGYPSPSGVAGLDMGHYFDFSRSFMPQPTDLEAEANENTGANLT